MGYKQAMHRTTNGVTGFNLAKILEFLTGEKPVKSLFCDKTKSFTFYLRDKHFEYGENMLKSFEDFFQTEVKRISTIDPTEL